jgi:hypothetical protein
MRTPKLLVLLMLSVAWCFSESLTETTVRGKLTLQDGKPALKGAGAAVILSGDEATLGVLNDKRLLGSDIEAAGHYSGKIFVVNPIHTKALYVYHDGQRHTISYWCKVCSIRTYSPGPCMCCQEDTALDLQPVEKK